MPHLTSAATLYVDASAGNDSNPGTQQAPFKTIQAAIDSLPKDLGNFTATINVEEGEYLEDVVISGFIGGRFNSGIKIVGSSACDTTRHINTLFIHSNASAISVKGLYVTGNYAGYAVHVNASNAYFEYMNIANTGAETVDGLVVGKWATAGCSIGLGTLIDGYTHGVLASNASVVTMNGVTVKNCTTGIMSGDSGNQTNAIVMLNSSIAFDGNDTDTAAFKASQIFTQPSL